MTTPIRIIDLTPFGYTPTEAASYSCLLAIGPSSGYAVASALSIARANAYQALRGLVAKGAAAETGSDPKIFRAIRPQDLLVRIARDQAAKLDALDREITALDSPGAPATTPFTGERELHSLVLRVATREPGPVECLAPAEIHSLLLPIWRKRSLEALETRLWVVGAGPDPFPVEISGEVDEALVARYFGGPVTLLLTRQTSALALIRDGHPAAGQLTSEPAVVGAARAALAALTSPS